MGLDLMISHSVEDMEIRFQQSMKKYEKDDKLTIFKIMDNPGSKPGDNYTSQLIRTQLIGRRGDGTLYKNSCMRKKLIECPVGDFLNLPSLFRNEKHVYENILSCLGTSFGPRLIYATDNNIVMEDLAVKGYAICERRNFLDWNHAIFALKKLSEFHAETLAIKINNSMFFEEMIQPLNEVIYDTVDSTSTIRLCTEKWVKTTVEQLKEVKPLTPELKKVLAHISSYTNKTYDMLYNLFNGPKQKYYTICHGDPWNNNFLFQHNDNGDIVDLKMVDYQITRHMSSSTDVLYLIYTSVHSSLIEERYDDLIKYYHDEFIKKLREKGIKEDILAELGMDWLQAELKTFAFYGALIGCTLAHPMLADETDVEQFEKFSSEDLISGKGQLKMTDEKNDRIQRILSHYYNKYGQYETV